MWRRQAGGGDEALILVGGVVGSGELEGLRQEAVVVAGIVVAERYPGWRARSTSSNSSPRRTSASSTCLMNISLVC